MRGSCQNMSIALSKNVILGEVKVSEAEPIHRIPLKTLSLFPEGI